MSVAAATDSLPTHVLTQSHAMAKRDDILDYAAEFLDLGSFPDYGPQGMQVVGADEVTRIVCAVSSSLELFQRAAAVGAQLILVHHGLLWESEPRTIDRRMRGRLQALFDADLTLAAYHLALDAHPEVGNNALLARELGVKIEKPFQTIGVGGRPATPAPLETFLNRVRERIAPEPLVFAEGPDPVERVAILSGGGSRYLADAAREGYDLYLTGEPAEPSLHTARELGITFVAAGHYATERLGIQALTARLAERFAVEWEFVELPNPV
jgi:dinuclear metal center YbgI/SA1388 family protein